MNTTEKIVLLSSKLMLASATGNQKEIEKISKELTAAQRQMQKTANNSAVSDIELCGFVKFTKKEISQMSEGFKKIIILAGCRVHARKRKSGKHGVNYELRVRRDGYKIEVSSNDLTIAKQKFINAVNKYQLPTQESNDVPNIFQDFAEFYFNKFWRRKVTERTYETEFNRYKNHIKPFIGTYSLNAITPLMCQQIIDRLCDLGFGKTSDEVFSILNMIFKSAINHNLISNNPMCVVVHRTHDKKHGKALTKAEEKLLLNALSGTKYQQLFAVALYSGLRPNEYKTAHIENGFIVAVNSKRKNGKVEYKKVPIIPMLRPYLNNSDVFKFPGIDYMRERLKSILPNHILYDLRTTFYTRCQECGVAEVARDEFMGHSHGGLADIYTDLSDEFLIKESKKLNY